MMLEPLRAFARGGARATYEVVDADEDKAP